MLIFWSSVYLKKGFLEDESGKFIPRNEILEALESAVVFYYVKKDKEIERLVRKYLMSKPKLKEVSREVKKIVFEKYPLLEGIKIPEKIYVDKDKITQELIKVFDLEKKEFVRSFRGEVFKGVIENVEIESENMEKIKTACKAYTRALAEYEHKAVKESELEDVITEIQNSIANEWEIPLRVGEWTLTPYKGDLLFFWRDKEVREYLLKELKKDIRPKDVLFIPRTNEFLGWAEVK
ncbi:hypothetical protein [Caminibacter sp.]